MKNIEEVAEDIVGEFEDITGWLEEKASTVKEHVKKILKERDSQWLKRIEESKKEIRDKMYLPSDIEWTESVEGHDNGLESAIEVLDKAFPYEK